MDNETCNLPQRTLLLCACAAQAARGDMASLDTAIRKALDGGVTVNEMKDAFAQLYAYTGFPRSLNALNLLERVLADRKAHGIEVTEGKPFVRPAAWDDAAMALEQGKYYCQGGVTYLCIRDTGDPVYHDLSTLVGLYVQAV